MNRSSNVRTCTAAAIVMILTQVLPVSAGSVMRRPAAQDMSARMPSNSYRIAAQINASNPVVVYALPNARCILDFNSDSPMRLDAPSDGRIELFFTPLNGATLPQTRVVKCASGARTEYLQLLLDSGRNPDAIPLAPGAATGIIPFAERRRDSSGGFYDNQDSAGFFAQGPVGTFSSVYGKITVPNFYLSQIPPGNENAAFYVGIDGGCLSTSCSTNTYQAGVLALMTDKNGVLAETYQAFAQSTYGGFYGSFYTKPNDQIFCHIIYQVANNQVNMNHYCYDEQTGQTMNHTYTNVGTTAVRDTAEWYVARYPRTALFQFGSVSITGADVIVGGTLFGVNNLYQSTTYPVSSVQMVAQSGATLAATNPVPPGLPSQDTVGFNFEFAGP